MPIYEFYCPGCHMIFNFFTRTVDTEKCPACPRCARTQLERQVSRFAVSRNRPEPDEDYPPGLDEARMEQAMAALAGEADGLDENDPVQAANLMRKFCAAAGLETGSRMEEALKRLEAGEDPDALADDMADVFESENPFAETAVKRLRRKLLPPQRDEKLYEL